MKASIVPIGNSKGIRIPKSVLDQCQIRDEVDLNIENGNIVLKPLHNIPRIGWAEQFERMHEMGEDKLEESGVDLIGDWEW
jgi:antitoxin MazE